MYWIFTISLISHATSLLPLGWSLRRRPTSSIIRLVQILTAASFVFDSVSLYYGWSGHNTYPINNFFLLVQFVILLLVYRYAFSWPARVVYWLGAMYTVFFAVNYAVGQGPLILNSYSYTLAGIILILLSLLYFRYVLIMLPETYVHRSPMIWINIAVLVYFGGNLFLFMLYNYFASGIWILHNMLNIIKNVLLFIAVWQSQRKMNSSSF